MSVALNTTTYPIRSQACSLASKYNTKELQLGDGYKEIELDGLNYDREEWSLTFIPMANATCITLMGILLESVNGISKVLSWTPPGEGTTKYWTASDINKSHLGAGYYVVTCKLTKYFLVA